MLKAIQEFEARVEKAKKNLDLAIIAYEVEITNATTKLRQQVKPTGKMRSTAKRALPRKSTIARKKMDAKVIATKTTSVKFTKAQQTLVDKYPIGFGVQHTANYDRVGTVIGHKLYKEKLYLDVEQPGKKKIGSWRGDLVEGWEPTTKTVEKF